MPRRAATDPDEPRPRRRPASTPQDREDQLIAMAYDLAERRIEAGTASSQEVTHFLKLGSSRERLEQQRLSYENELTQMKTKAIQDQAQIQELYVEAIKAMKSYGGHGGSE